MIFFLCIKKNYFFFSNNDDVHKILYKVRKKFILGDDDDDDDDEHDIEGREEEEEESAKQTSSGLKAYVSYVKKVLEIYITYLDPDANPDDIEDSVGEMTLNAVKFARKVYKVSGGISTSLLN